MAGDARRLMAGVDQRQLKAAKGIAGLGIGPTASAARELRAVLPKIEPSVGKMQELKPVMGIASSLGRGLELKPALGIAQTLANMSELKPALGIAATLVQQNRPTLEAASGFLRQNRQSVDTAAAIALQARPSIEAARHFSSLRSVISGRVLEAVNAVAAAMEERRRTLGELSRYASEFERDSAEELRHAGAFLRMAVNGYEEGAEADDEYAFAVVYHLAVGAMEEIARKAVGDRTLTLRQAVTKLALSERISTEARDWLVELYETRNTEPGLGHGAGACPEYVASFALSAVLRGVEALVPSSALPAAEGAEEDFLRE